MNLPKSPKNIFAALFILGIIGISAFTVSLIQQKQEVKSYAQVPKTGITQIPTPSLITPTLYCMGSCPTTPPSPTGVLRIYAIPTGMVTPTGFVPGVLTANPTGNPCIATASVTVQNYNSHHHTRGNVSGIVELILKFFLELLNFFLKLLGINGINLPNNGQNPIAGGLTGTPGSGAVGATGIPGIDGATGIPGANGAGPDGIPGTADDTITPGLSGTTANTPTDAGGGSSLGVPSFPPQTEFGPPTDTPMPGAANPTNTPADIGPTLGDPCITPPF